MDNTNVGSHLSRFIFSFYQEVQPFSCRVSPLGCLTLAPGPLLSRVRGLSIWALPCGLQFQQRQQDQMHRGSIAQRSYWGWWVDPEVPRKFPSEDRNLCSDFAIPWLLTYAMKGILAQMFHSVIRYKLARFLDALVQAPVSLAKLHYKRWPKCVQFSSKALVIWKEPQMPRHLKCKFLEVYTIGDIFHLPKHPTVGSDRMDCPCDLAESLLGD